MDISAHTDAECSFKPGETLEYNLQEVPEETAGRTVPNELVLSIDPIIATRSAASIIQLIDAAVEVIQIISEV